MQNLGFAPAVPMFLAFHLLTSSVVDKPSPEAISLNLTQLKALPIGFSLGYIAPTIAMALPEPRIISLPQKQALCALWQAFPFTIYMAQQITVFLISLLTPTSPGLSDIQKNTNFLRQLRYVYTFGLAVSAIVHLGTWTLSICSVLFPVIFAPGIANLLHPVSVFGLKSLVADVKAPNPSDGVKWVLQWDFAIGGAAMLVWAATLRLYAEHRPPGVFAYVSHFLWLGIASAVVGPAGAALLAIWERDELVMEKRGKGGAP